MRKIIVAGNWKMNLEFEEAKTLVDSLNNLDLTVGGLDKVLIFPPFPYLKPLMDLKLKAKIGLGAQNVSSEEKGAFTGEVSAKMLSSIGIEYTLIGHSE
ncbi:MAG TPA: triose-phosphate isomerase, partial [Flavobacteriales bacterium]|nr:triose-phosphate isomerase [Flavobacteriales bacterium]